MTTSTLQLILEVGAAVLGGVAVIEARGKSWAGWGVIAVSAALLLGRL